MRISDKKVNTILKNQIARTFFQTVADMKDAKEVDIFFSSFLTDSEMETYAKRLAVAYWLKKGRSYANIKENLKVSSATIATVQDMMNKPGFVLALKKMEAEEWANQWAEKIQKVSPFGKRKLATK
jgi:TrpR-related protein YerC/YecD